MYIPTEIVIVHSDCAARCRTLLLVFALGSVLLPACRDTAEVARQLEVEDLRYLRNADGTRVLRGQLVNPTDRRVSNIQIDVSLLDSDNQRVDQALITVAEVEAGGRTSFRHVVDVGESVQRARIRQIRVL